MNMKVRYIGLDVHKDTIVIAVADEGRQEARVWKTIPYDTTRLLKALKLLQKEGERLEVCYEAGPTGYELHRRLTEAGIACQVVAPSLTPSKSGDRIKTDRRDAARLAHFLRSGDLTEVYVPDEATEALRDLERARDAAKRAERTARHQLAKFLLRHGRRWEGGSSWTKKHLEWIRRQEFAQEAQQRVLRDYLKTVEDAAERVARLEADLAELIEQSALAPLVKSLMAMRGIAQVSAAVIAAEIGDLRRFATAGEFMAYVGLVPSEHSSGGSVRRGRITRCGNGYVRRILVEAAHHYRRAPSVSQALRKRQEGVPEPVRRIAWEAQKRLHGRLRRLTARGKPYNQAIAAVARELAGFVWAIGQEAQPIARSAA